MAGSNWWQGNWWAGAAAAPSGSPALDDQIMDLIKPALQTITVAGGYHQNVTVHRPPVGALQFKAADCPALVIRRSGKTIRTHIRRAEEFILTVKVICLVADAGGDPHGDLANLIIDLKKVVYLNRRWNNGVASLARRTWFNDDNIHETEVSDDTLTGVVVFQILARADRTDLSKVKVV